MHTSRRTFLGWLARGSLVTVTALATGEAIRYFSFEPVADAPTAVTVGQPGDYPSGALTYVAAARAYIGHDANGLYALDAVCTHLGCLVEQRSEGGFACPCHGSQYSAAGEVHNGPATAPLAHLGLQLGQDGHVVVNRAQPVAPAARLALPA
jgi:cytochrome b6-f complex iron-sulfur subunit